MFRIIKEARPNFVLAENVAGIIKMALDDVLSQLEGEGYTTGTVVLPACSLNAPHRRDRVWIMAHAECGSKGDKHRGMGEEKHGEEGAKSQLGRVAEIAIHGSGSSKEDVAHADSNRPQTLCSGPGIPPQTSGAPKTPNLSGVSGGINPNTGEPGLQGAEQSGASAEGKRSSRAITKLGGFTRTNWLTEPNVGRVAHGIPSRTHRLKALGNAIVPQVAYEIIRLMDKQD
jgi:DNA (cytosine-5)-methyltransferase 1